MGISTDLDTVRRYSTISKNFAVGRHNGRWINELRDKVDFMYSGFGILKFTHTYL